MLKTGKKILTIKSDSRGWLIEILKKEDIPKDILKKGFGQVYLTVAKPGAVRGNHYHKRKTEWFCVIKGKGKLVLQDINSKEKEELIIGHDNMLTVKIPPNTFHKIENTFDEDMYIVAYIDEEFNPKDPDTYYDFKAE